MIRNREFGKFAVLFFFLAAVSVTAGFAVSRPAGILAALSAVSFGTAFFLFTRARYKSIARISDQIDLVLHNADRLYIGDVKEGELSILHSEITKMTQRIREQNDALKKEKSHLADSLADIAHQLRTPLTSVNLILSLLGGCQDEDQRNLLLREAKELLVRMDWLITSLLKISRLDAGIVVFRREEIDVGSLICDALRPFLIPMEIHRIGLRADVPEGMKIQGDFGWLSEAVQNIIKNCMENAGDDGMIEIVCEENPLYAGVSIRDSGKGFQKEDLSRLFERFYRGDGDSGSGYGIGLALCRMIITGQGGTVTAKNHPQGGAVFAIRFPK